MQIFIGIQIKNASQVTQYTLQIKNQKESYLIPNSFIFDFIKKDALNKEITFELEENRNRWNFKIRKATKNEIENQFKITTGIDTDSVNNVDGIGFRAATPYLQQVTSKEAEKASS